jgi:hypothetical protein
MKKFFVILAGILCAAPSFAVDLTQVEKDLNGPGITGWVHGAVKDRSLYVFTYRDPKNFFDFVEMSLTTSDPAIESKLATFGRHDKVLVKGRFLKNPSPQKHIRIASIELVEKYRHPYPSEEYRYGAKLPDDLLHASRATFLVHAVAGDGRILVLEYKDQIVPMYVKNGALTKNLFRNDLVDLALKIQEDPEHPTHLNLDDTAANPVKVVEAIRDLHGKPAVLDGELILFPQSPEIRFNVFAVQQSLPAGLSRQFTLVNFDDPNEFQKIRAKLQAEWDKFPKHWVNGRNKLVSTKIRVRAKGTYNEIDPGQANPQILLKSAADVEIYER